MTTPESHFATWTRQVELAEQMIPIIGRLYRQHGVVTTIFGRPLTHCSTIEIIRQHRYSRQILSDELFLEQTFPLLEVLSKMAFCPTEIDLGKLANSFAAQDKLSLKEFLHQKLLPLLPDPRKGCPTPRDIVLYGFGRIGRLLTRLLVEHTGGGSQLRLRAIVVRKGSEGDLQKRASLLRRDSVHGQFHGTIRVDEVQNALVVNGHMIKIIYAGGPDEVDYTEHGIHDALVIDNTGVWKDREGLGRHLKAKGVEKVLLTAPASGDIPNIVYGLNQDTGKDGETIFSAASCTTNAAAPVMKVLNDTFGIVHGHLETCHSFTNDQNLIDNYHKKARRGRSAALNMVITETGAAKAVGKVIPELLGKMTGNAIRVPTPNVSLAILNLQLEKETTVEELNETLRQTALDSPLQDVLDFTTSPEVVSSDFVGSRYACVVDATATIVQGKSCVLYVWYDNEFGYSTQVVRLAGHIAGLQLAATPD